MEKQIERKENLQVVVSIKANGDEWKKLVKKAYNKRASNVVVKGFRKGKAPADMVKARINHGDVLSDALNVVANQGYKEALNENRLYPYSQPQLNVTKLDDEEVECTITFDLPPQITLGAYKNLNIGMDEVSVSDDDVKAYIDNLRNQHALMQVKDGEAQLNDTVIIDFVGYVDEEKFDGGSAKGYELKLGSNQFIPGFEDQLVGIKAGEERTINVTFPENYVESLKGKAAKFVVTCQDVKETIMPEVDDDFIKDLNIAEVTDLASLNDYASKQTLQDKTNQARQNQVEKIVNTAINNAQVVIPNSMIQEEAKAMLDNIMKTLNEKGLTYEDYVAINGLKEDELAKQREAQAASDLKSYLVVEKIIVQENLDATDEVIENEYKKMAEMYSMSVDAVRKALEPNKENFRRQLRNRLFTDFMLAHNDVKKEEPTEEKVEETVSEEAK
jgi:trigger factor